MTEQEPQGEPLVLNPDDPKATRAVVAASGAVSAGATSYVLLYKRPDGAWEVEAKYEARTSEAAIRLHVGGVLGDGKPVTLVAIPERSFRPVTVTPKTTTTLVIEEA